MRNLLQKYFGPKSNNPDIRRKELVLNSMLAFCFLLIFVFEILTISHELSSESYIGVFYFLLTLLPFGASYYFSRTSRINTASVIFIATFSVGSFYGIMIWSMFLPATLLSLTLMTILTGILVNSRSAFIYALGASIILIAVSSQVTNGQFASDLSWQKSTPSIGDAIEFGIFILFMAGVSWISNKQTELSLLRARTSEQELRIERDNLEIRVAERSKQLEQMQIEKISEIYKFIEFGKLSSGLIHDLINPLNALCIEIETSPARENHSADRAVKASVNSLMNTSRKIKDIIGSAKKHIQINIKEERFSIKDLINETLLVHKHRLYKNQIEVKTHIQSGPILFGPPSLLTHIITNLISNAIDAIEEAKLKFQAMNGNYRPIIQIDLETKDKKAVITIKDNGAGIPSEMASNIFNPFFSTKDGKGCGYGLSASRHMAEKYFKGELILLDRNTHIHNTSKMNKFKTAFQLTLPLQY